MASAGLARQGRHSGGETPLISSAKLTPKKRKAIQDASDRKRRRFFQTCFTGARRLSMRHLIAKLDGPPLIFMEPGVETTCGRRGMDEDCGGRPLRDRFEASLHAFVRANLALQRRVILVRNASDIPCHLRLAASLVGARVQETLLTPLLQFQRVEGMHLAFTKNFATHRQQARS